MHTIQGQALPSLESLVKITQKSNRTALPLKREPKRMRKEKAEEALIIAIEKEWIQLGLLVSWGYQFLSRTKSELLEQGNQETMKLTREGVRFGPTKRRNRDTIVAMERKCLRGTKHKIPCPRLWPKARPEEMYEFQQK